MNSRENSWGARPALSKLMPKPATLSLFLDENEHKPTLAFVAYIGSRECSVAATTTSIEFRRGRLRHAELY